MGEITRGVGVRYRAQVGIQGDQQFVYATILSYNATD